MKRVAFYGCDCVMLDLPEKMNIEAMEANAARGAALLKAIGSKWRLLILCNLVESEKSVGQLEALLGISQSALSQHLMVLRREDLVKTRRAAQMIFYSLNGAEVSAVLSTLHGLYCNTD